ncbi:MAG: LptF/LptG family permease [Planctomycetales bacterium]|nr:LptF/LptG family permease [Planctomycetales bacterium]
MPTRVTRYVIAELTKVFVATVSALVALLVLVGIVQEGLKNGLTPAVMLRLIPFTLPNAMCIALPGSVLFAVCSVFGRISASNEIVAIKSLGISPKVVMLPAIWFATIASAANVWLMDVGYCWGYPGIQRVVISSIRETAYSVLRTKHDFSTHGVSFHVREVRDDRLVEPLIVARAGNQTITISAREAELRRDDNPEVLMLSLTDGSVEVGSTASFSFTDTIEYPLPLGLKNERSALRNPAHVWSHQIRSEGKLQSQRIASLEESLAVTTAFQITGGDFSNLRNDEWKSRHADLASAQQRLIRLRLEPWRRWASGFSCLAFALVGVPLAIRMRNADFLTSFFLCFLPILLVYYPLFAFGLDQAKTGDLPPHAIWLGNLVCVLIGIYLIRYVQRR